MKPKVLIITTPIRPVPSEYPPMGSLCVIKSLKKAGNCDVEFYDIDNNRPQYQEALAGIKKRNPDILGISAVVSTAYAYVKQISLDIKRLLPNTAIILGGNLAASSEILLKKTGVDYCVIGEGEIVIKNFVEMWSKTKDKAAFRSVKGLMYLDRNGSLVNTGYEDTIPNYEVYDFDWADLACSSNINHFFPEIPDLPTWNYFFQVRTKEGVKLDYIPKGRKEATIVASKGCVARCTFCHRWDKGIRYIPPDVVIDRIRYVMKQYDAGYISFSDENFGTDKKWLAEFCQKIKPLGLRWRVGGMRVGSLTPGIIDTMKDAGCVTIICGMETGSAKMLEVMEKKVKLENNYNVMKWIIERGLYTAVQLVIGMPGETPETIRETIEFTKFANTLSPHQNPNALSINYAQALPGTPLYEYARHKGLIGTSIDHEEEYLLSVSDKNASGAFDTLNFTDYPKLICETWQPLIQIETNYTYIQKFGLEHYYDVILGNAKSYGKRKHESGYFQQPLKSIEQMAAAADTVSSTFSKESKFVLYEASQKKGFYSIWSLMRQNRWRYLVILHPIFAYRIRHFLPLICLIRSLKQQGAHYAWTNLQEFGLYYLKKWFRFSQTVFQYKSLRRMMDWEIPATPGDPAMIALRKGR